MQPSLPIRLDSSISTWAGRVLSAALVLFLLSDAAMKIVKADPAVEGAADMGYPESTLVGIGLALLVCTVLYAIPRTAVLGAILLTGYLGGAVASSVRIEDAAWVFPALFGVVIWVALYLRNGRLRDLVPLTASRE